MTASLGYGADELASLLITAREEIEVVHWRRGTEGLPYKD